MKTLRIITTMCLVALVALSADAKKKAKAPAGPQPTGSEFVITRGHDLMKPDGTRLFIRGTNLGNWLNPEGYMFGFQKTNSAGRINEMFCELVGPEATADFWRQFKDNYVTRKDIEFLASTGVNTLRLPFHYKLFTDEDYMGLTACQDGFERIDSVVSWCRDNGIYVILDMHDCPGGQTGDNIDDSYGYPWLFESEAAQQQFCDIWRTIARYYANEPVILGYDLMNEPIAPYFDNVDDLNAKLDPLYRRVVKEIRKVDPNHIVIIGAPQWNGNFAPLSTGDYDDNLMFTCHRYGGDASVAAIGNFIEFRDRSGKPMYMGEIGHNTDEWQAAFVRAMEESNIGFTFWPYKKIKDSSMVGFDKPEGWDAVITFSEAPRGSYKEVRDARPPQAESLKAMMQLLENVKFENCHPQAGYIRSLGLTIDQ